MLLPRLVNRAMLELEFIERELIHNVEASIDFVNHFFFFPHFIILHTTHTMCVCLLFARTRVGVGVVGVGVMKI